MFPVRKLLFSALSVAIPWSLWKIFQIVWYRPLCKSPLRHLRGPKTANLILGNFSEIAKDHNGVLTEMWVKEYGNTIRFKGFFNKNHLLSMDTRVVHHVLTHPDAYQKSPHTRHVLGQIFGEGLLVVEGTQHRQQRRVMNPAFGPIQIRALTETFFEKAIRLRDLWSAEIAKNPTTTTGTRIDIAPWLSRVTLDIIGLTGFGYDFDALESSGQANELGEAFTTMFLAIQGVTITDILRLMVPILRLIPNAKARKLEAAQRDMTRIGMGLLTRAKAAALASVTEGGEIEKNSLRGRDLLSVLVRANMASDIPEAQKLSDKDVIAQISTFLVAGHETTSTTITWALFALTQAPEVQRKLRHELLSVETETPSMDELLELPYLDAVLKETLRVWPPIRSTARLAMNDDVLPVREPYTDRYGNVRDTIGIAKGESITIPIQAINRSKELWGPDAHEFNPERWNDIPEAASQIPGVWGHSMSFIGGPRACIGFRFSLVESKAILFSLVRSFEFELAVPKTQIISRTFLAQRPVLQGGPSNESSLPLLFRPYKRV